MTSQQLHEYWAQRKKDTKRRKSMSDIISSLILLSIVALFGLCIYFWREDTAYRRAMQGKATSNTSQGLTARDSAKIAVDFWQAHYPTSYRNYYKK